MSGAVRRIGRVRFCLRLVLAGGVLVAAGLAGAAPAAAQTQCQFTLGFEALRRAIGPASVGECLEDEHFNPENGNSEQRTRNGLFVWRKADNWTAFTDGYSTWLSGPGGVQKRLNTERFSWEADAPPTGTIRGSMNYPSNFIPAMRVYAISVAGDRHYVAATRQNEASFTITGVAPGTYYVLAYPLIPGIYISGAWSRYVSCGETASCTDHALLPVAVRAGEAVTGVRVRDWYASFDIPPPDWRDHWPAVSSVCWTGGANNPVQCPD